MTVTCTFLTPPVSYMCVEPVTFFREYKDYHNSQLDLLNRILESVIKIYKIGFNHRLNNMYVIIEVCIRSMGLTL